MRAIGLVVLLSTAVAEAQVQDLGRRLPAGAGVDAGTQIDEGLYIGDRVTWFSSSEVHDRRGDVVPVEGLDIDAYANILGIAGTKKLDDFYVSAAISIPYARFQLSADQPLASVDRLGFGDIFIQPIKLGYRFRRVDAVAGYSIYVPNGQRTPTGLGNPQWTNQLSAGGTLFFDDQRGWRLSALASYVHNGQKQDIDITRGSTLMIQGGVGGSLTEHLDLGVAGYAVWQVTDDRGSDVPMALRGSRERAVGLGPEVGLAIPRLRSRVNARVMWDLDGRTRPVGTTVVIGWSVVAWR